MAETKTVPTLDRWLLDYDRIHIEQTKRGEDQRTQVAVSIHRRFRGVSMSDRIGRFIPGGTGMWRGDDPEDLDGVDLKTINITKPTIKMNQSALCSAHIDIDNEAANKEFALEGAANVADGITEYLDGHEDHWSDKLVSRMVQTMQTGYGVFVRTRHNPHKKSQEVVSQEWEDQEDTIPGEYACHCGAGGVFEGDETDQVKCPECGDMAEVVKAPEQATIPKPGQAQSFNPGDNETSVSSCFEHRIDERKSQGGNIREAKWFEHHYLVTDTELQREFGNFDFGAKASEWCYALKWKWALETGDDVFRTNTWGSFQSSDANSRRERRDWYLLPEEYSERIEPADYELKDSNGNVVFSIKRGEKLIDKCPKGFKFSIVNDKIAPCWEEIDFRDEWSYACWTPDAHSFWGQPLVELLQIQDDWNTLYTIDIQHRERNSINQIVYNSMMFDADAWEQDLVPTNQGYDQSQGLDFYFKQLQAVPMQEAVTGLKFLFDILPYVGGAPPEAIGVDPPGDDNYHAQLLRKQSTMGQLQPPGASLAECKVSVFRNHFKIAQNTWPIERFEYIKTRFGEEWKPDDIEAFIQCNLDRDITTDYVEGSEVPTSRIEKIIDMEQAIQKFIDAGVPPPKEILRQYFELKGLDYDLGGMEADERLADVRYRTIKKSVEMLKGQVSSQPVITVDPMSGQPIPGPSMLTMQVMSYPQMTVKEGENHQVHIDYYVAQEKAIMAQEMPDMELVECLDEMIVKHKQAMAGGMQEETAMQVIGQQPAMQAAQSMQPGQPDPQAQADAQAQQAQADAENQANQEQLKAQNQAQLTAGQQEHDAAMSAMQIAHEQTKMDKEHAHQAEMKAMELQSKERQAKTQSQQKAKQAKSKPKAA